jgi:hypothetical protein
LRVLDQDGRQVFFCGWRLIVVRGSFSQTAARLGGAIHGPVAWSPALLQRLCRRHCGSGCGRGGIPGLGCCDAGGAAIVRCSPRRISWRVAARRSFTPPTKPVWRHKSAAAHRCCYSLPKGPFTRAFRLFLRLLLAILGRATSPLATGCTLLPGALPRAGIHEADQGIAYTGMVAVRYACLARPAARCTNDLFA